MVPSRQRGQVFNLGREIRVIQEVVVDRAVEDHDPDLLVGLESVDDFLELLDHFRAHDVDRRVVDRDTPIGGRPPGQANLCGAAGAFISVSLVGAFIVAMGFSSVTIQPEQNGPRNWTMVSPILSYRLPCAHA